MGYNAVGECYNSLGELPASTTARRSSCGNLPANEKSC
jgi:hypothetical protein